MEREKLKNLYNIYPLIKLPLNMKLFANTSLLIVDLCIFASNVFVLVFFLRNEGNMITYPFASGIMVKDLEPRCIEPRKCSGV